MLFRSDIVLQNLYSSYQTFVSLICDTVLILNEYLYFFRLNKISQCLAQSRHLSCALDNMRQLHSVDSSQTSKLMSSMNSLTLSLSLVSLHVSRSSAAQNKQSMSNNSNFYEISALISIFSILQSFSINVVVLSVMKKCIHLIRFFDISLIFKT